MIDINKFNFGKETLRIIDNMDTIVRQISIEEGEETSLEALIEESISGLENNLFEGWTDKEKYVFTLGTLMQMIKSDYLD